MRLLTLLTFILISFSALAQEDNSCENILARLEENHEQSAELYNQCGFDDETLVWEKWAGYATVNKLPRALYEICIRYPDHVYHDMYCERSAGLGYGPAFVVLGQQAFQKGDAKKGTELFALALNSKELTSQQEAQILETLGIQADRENHKEKALMLLTSAAKKGSALANNYLGVYTYMQAPQDTKKQKESFDYFWRAILLGCPLAEENLGLFHLVRLKKLPLEDALKIMKFNDQTCQASVPTETVSDKKLLSCQCQKVLKEYERLSKQPYLLLSIEGVQAQLKTKNNTTITVSKGDDLADGYRVAELRKTALILTRGRGERIILNLFSDQECQQFCEKYGIYDDLSLSDMNMRVNKTTPVKVKPYHLTFTQQECESINYYAPQYVDVSQPYTGKEECQQVEVSQQQQVLLQDLLKDDNDNEEVTSDIFQPRKEDFEDRSLSDGEKEYFLELGSIVEKNANGKRK